MRHSKHSVRLLGLVVVSALGLMAFGSVALNAALPGDSTPGEFELGEPTMMGASLLGKQEATMELHVQGRNITIRCSNGHANGKFVTSKEALVTIEFTGCKTFEFGTEIEITECVLKGGKETITATASILPILHGEELFILAEVDSPSTNFSVISYEGGKGCVLPLNTSLTGTVTAQAPSTDAVKPLLTSSKAIQELTGDKLFFGGFEAFLNASATVELTGFHEGYSFSIS
jgi:hypothetical protein